MLVVECLTVSSLVSLRNLPPQGSKKHDRGPYSVSSLKASPAGVTLGNLSLFGLDNAVEWFDITSLAELVEPCDL